MGLVWRVSDLGRESKTPGWFLYEDFTFFAPNYLAAQVFSIPL
jgi:hypothetical protein